MTGRLFIVIALCLLAAACGAAVTAMPTPPSPTPYAISTRYLAELVGQLELVDGCLRVQSSYGPESLLLAWPADITATVSGETVQVTDLLQNRHATWRIGDTVTMGGGELPSLDESVHPVGPASCPGPYWVVGSVEASRTPTPAAITATPASAMSLAPVAAASVNLRAKPGWVFGPY